MHVWINTRTCLIRIKRLHEFDFKPLSGSITHATGKPVPFNELISAKSMIGQANATTS